MSHEQSFKIPSSQLKNITLKTSSNKELTKEELEKIYSYEFVCDNKAMFASDSEITKRMELLKKIPS